MKAHRCGPRVEGRDNPLESLRLFVWHSLCNYVGPTTGGREMDVRDIMTRNPFSIEQDTPLRTAIDMMVERKVRHLPVVDERGAVIGIITDRDLRSAVLTPALEPYLSEAARRRLRGVVGALESLRVKDAMTCNPITTRPDMPVTQAAALMLEARIGSLPVIENGKLIGIVTDRDAVKALAMHVPTLKYVTEALW
jgi:acetoin utilization protein AcuB